MIKYAVVQTNIIDTLNRGERTDNRNGMNKAKYVTVSEITISIVIIKFRLTGESNPFLLIFEAKISDVSRLATDWAWLFLM